MLRGVLLILLAAVLENRVDEPHIQPTVEVEDSAQLAEAPHKQILHKILQILHRRLIRQKRIERKNQQRAVNRQRVIGFLPAVIRQVF